MKLFEIKLINLNQHIHPVIEEVDLVDQVKSKQSVQKKIIAENFINKGKLK